MSSIKHKPCYGTMLPHGQPRHHIDGKVFKLHEVGPVGMMVRTRVVETDITEWDDCRNCEEFQHCYQLCIARIATENAVHNE